MHTATFWAIADGPYLSCVLHHSREEADRHSVSMMEHHNQGRTACLKLVISWEDGQGIDFPAMELQHVQD